MPYLYRAGTALVAAQFAEAARVLRAGGDFVILNLSYRGDLELDREDARRLGAAVGLRVLRNGTRGSAAVGRHDVPPAQTRGRGQARRSVHPVEHAPVARPLAGTPEVLVALTAAQEIDLTRAFADGLIDACGRRSGCRG